MNFHTAILHETFLSLPLFMNLLKKVSGEFIRKEHVKYYLHGYKEYFTSTDDVMWYIKYIYGRFAGIIDKPAPSRVRVNYFSTADDCDEIEKIIEDGIEYASWFIETYRRIICEHVHKFFKKYKQLHNKNYKLIRTILIKNISYHNVKQILNDYLEIKPIRFNLKNPKHLYMEQKIK